MSQIKSNHVNTGAVLSHKPDGLHYTGSDMFFRINGLQPYNLDRLRITLKASILDKPELFHIDTLDLYNSRSRDTFAEACHKYLKVEQSSCRKELTELISLLEQERIAMQQRAKSPKIPSMSKEQKQEAMDLLKSKDLIERIIKDFDGLGLIGEKHNKLLGYLATISRLLPDPLGVLILSRSGAGKTMLQDAICKFVPPESCIQYTRLTGQSLFYRDKDALKNKVLAIEEEEGMWDAMYSIRTLQSSQKLSIASTRADAKTGKMYVDEYTVYGPVVLMISTTNPDALDPETRQRFLILTIDESQQQTKSILRMQRHRSSFTGFKFSADETSITQLHHNMQRLLKPLTPVFPDNLKIEYPYSRLQMRREQGKYLSLIKTITLMRQYQRRKGTIRRADDTIINYVLVNREDVELGRELGRMVFYRNVDDVSPTGRRLLHEIAALTTEKYKTVKEDDPNNELQISQLPFTRKELRERTGWSESQLRQNIAPLVDLGYLGVLKGSWGATYRYVLLDDGKNDPKIEI